MSGHSFITLLRCAALPVFAVVVAGCGAGSGDDSSSTRGSNGLPYGETGQELEDVLGVTMNLIAGGYTTAGGGSTSVTGGQTVRIDSGLAGAVLNGVVEIGGENVTISDNAGTTSGGQLVQVVYDPSRSGTYAGSLDVVVFQGMSILSESSLVFGFESDPAAIAGRTGGSLTYTGGFQGSGELGTEFAEYEGTMTLTANFAGLGAVSGSLDGTVGGSTNADMTFSGIGISGSGYSGATSCSSGCIGSGAINGAFYGPNADEVGGVLTFDFTAGGDDFIGSGTFVLTNPTP